MSTPKGYFHHEELYRKDVFDKLDKIHITVCGAGAIGSNLVDNLARQGFRRLRAIDFDRVEKHNINNQLYNRSNIGAQKVAALKSLVYQATETEIETFDKALTEVNAKKFLKGTDLVVDAFDNVASRRILKEYCSANALECLHAGLFPGYGEIIWNEVYKVPQESEGDLCDIALARNIVLLVVASATEEIINFIRGGKRRSLFLTLEDLKINVK